MEADAVSTTERDEVIARVVAETVRRYKKRAPWANVDDISQEAWAAALWAAPKWDPSKGPLAPLVATAAARWVSSWLIKSSSPVSEKHGRRHTLIGVRATSDETLKTRAVVHHIASGGTWADDLIEDREWRVRIVGRLLEVAQKTGAATVDELIATFEGVKKTRRDGPPTQEERAEDRRRHRDLRLRVARTVSALRKDPEMRDLWRHR